MNTINIFLPLYVTMQKLGYDTEKLNILYIPKI